MKTFYPKFLILPLMLLGCFSLMAQVTYVDGTASGANDGSSWANAYTDLSVALANTTAGDVWIAAGTYHPGEGAPDSSSTFRISTALQVFGGFAGTETTLAERDLNNNVTILSGDINNDDVEEDFLSGKSDNVQHVIVVDSLIAGTTVIHDLSITGGHTSDNNDQDEFFYRGGGIFTWSTVDVNNVQFYGNFARSGSGIYINGTASSGGDNSVVNNCNFTKQYTTSQSAGIFCQNVNNTTISNNTFVDNVTNRGSFYALRCTGVNMTDCLFSNNRSEFPTGFGGAMFNWNSTGWVVDNCTFQDNTAGNGAVMYHDGREAGRDVENLVFRNCTFLNNDALDFGGGTIYSWMASTTFEDCEFAGNSGSNGAHIFLGGTDMDIAIRDCSFERGIADFGGAHNCYGANSTWTLERNTYSSNTSTNLGGALIIGFQADVDITDCKFVENIADVGGAIFCQNDSTFIDYNNIEFESNMAGDLGGAIYSAGGIVSKFNDCTFFVNTAVNEGGALYMATINSDLVRGNLAIDNSVFTFNQSGANGGAISLVDMDTDLANSILSNNLTTGNEARGGGISVEATDSNAVEAFFINNTIVSNTGVSGSAIGAAQGAVASELIVNLQNNMMFNDGANFAITAGEPFFNSTGGNLVQDATMDAVLTNPKDQTSVADPLFVDQLNIDLHLQELSPAVDAGVAENAPEFDIEGTPRFGEVDAGAFEFDPTSSLNDLFIDNSALSILPNPVDKSLNFEFNEEYVGAVKMYIYTTNGQLLRTWEDNKVGTTYRNVTEVSDLAPGSYRLFVRFGKTAVVQHFVKL